MFLIVYLIAALCAEHHQAKLVESIMEVKEQVKEVVFPQLFLEGDRAVIHTSGMVSWIYISINNFLVCFT